MLMRLFLGQKKELREDQVDQINQPRNLETDGLLQAN
jgi:hypothetical protein